MDETGVAQIIFEWMTGHFPEMKKSQLVTEYDDIDEDKVGKIPFGKSRKRELTYNELKEMQDTRYGENHIEWIPLDELKDRLDKESG